MLYTKGLRKVSLLVSLILIVFVAGLGLPGGIDETEIMESGNLMEIPDPDPNPRNGTSNDFLSSLGLELLAHATETEEDGLQLSSYYTYNQLTYELQTLYNQYPDLVRVAVEGQSVENLKIWSITIGNGTQRVLVTGALHASEWITTSVMMETIKAYLQEYKFGDVDGEPIKYILDQYSITFLPMVNPDGVTLVQEGVEAFPHRKAELMALNPWGSDFSRWKANIQGVDLNRNFDARWGLPANVERLAFQPGHAFYLGPSIESEPETQAVATWVRKHQPELLLDYHSFGEILYWYYLQDGSDLNRDKTLVQAMRISTGYRMEKVRPTVLPSSTLTYWGSAQKIPSVCVEVGSRAPRHLTLGDVPYILNQVKYLPLVATINLMDYKPFVPVQEVSLPGSLVTELGATEVLIPVIFPSDASVIELSWSSSHPEIVAVNSEGIITALELGSAAITITTKDGDVAVCLVTVYPPLSGK